MPPPDCPCKVINGMNGYVRDNNSWIIGRIVRDFGSWSRCDKPIQEALDNTLDRRWEEMKNEAEKKCKSSGQTIGRPLQAGLCVSIYKGERAVPGHPGYDLVYFTGCVTIALQLAVAIIPLALYGDWSILVVTAGGILLSLATGSLGQWSKEKWACRRGSKKTIVLTKGNGSQHAIVVLGQNVSLDLEDLAGPTTHFPTSHGTRIMVITLAILWILLLITAAGITQHTWFLLAIGALGISQNVFVAGKARLPSSYGLPVTFEEVICEPRVMDTLFKVEEAYTRVGRSMLETFFPGPIRGNDEARWKHYASVADALDSVGKDKDGSTSSPLTSASLKP